MSSKPRAIDRLHQRGSSAIKYRARVRHGNRRFGAFRLPVDIPGWDGTNSDWSRGASDGAGFGTVVAECRRRRWHVQYRSAVEGHAVLPRYQPYIIPQPLRQTSHIDCVNTDPAAPQDRAQASMSKARAHKIIGWRYDRGDAIGGTEIIRLIGATSPEARALRRRGVLPEQQLQPQPRAPDQIAIAAEIQNSHSENEAAVYGGSHTRDHHVAFDFHGPRARAKGMPDVSRSPASHVVAYTGVRTRGTSTRAAIIANRSRVCCDNFCSGSGQTRRRSGRGKVPCSPAINSPSL